MTARHTPGKWKVIKGAADGDDMRCVVVVERGKMQYLIATIENGAPGDFCETEEANAALIAAAPELLAALRDLLGDRRNDENGKCLHCGRDNRGYDLEPCSDDCPGQVARAAIARATVTP